MRAAAGYFTSLRLEIPFEIVPPRFPQPAVPRPSREGTPETLLSLILSGMSRPRWALATPCGAPLRQAAAGGWGRRQGVLGGSTGLRSREKWLCIAFTHSVIDGFLGRRMPPCNDPQATRSDNIGMVHLQGSYRRSPFRGFSANNSPSLDPFKVFIPPLSPGVEQRNSDLTFRVYRLLSVRLVTITYRARQP